MTWNYRIVEYANGTGFGLHEVYYDAKGEPATMTERPIGFAGENVEDVRSWLATAQNDSISRPVLKEPEEWLRLEYGEDETEGERRHSDAQLDALAEQVRRV